MTEIEKTFFRFADAPPKDPAESMDVVLDLAQWCSNFWVPNEQFATNEYARPNTPTGFSYQATTGGTSGAREPRWPTTLGATVNDGSIVWTCAVAAANGYNAVTAPSAVSEPAGLTIGSVSASETTKILATYSGGTHGYDYAAVFAFTLRGISRVARQLVQVRRR
jgi:hypothetical protein